MQEPNRLADLRARSRDRALSRDQLPAEPMDLLAAWYGDAVDAQLRNPNAMTLCTVDASGQPSARTVLMKYLDADGPVFFTNYGSRKSREIEGNSRVSLLFFWAELERQVQIRGVASRISTTESLRYFLRRPRESQVGAWVSHQSEVLSARSVLESQFEQMKRKFAGGDVPLPSFWGGFRVTPAEVELWQGRAHRLHDRFIYHPGSNDKYVIDRLAP
ncbi:MAG TPA: pyridoxamine 5'-phosphate oxidase [Polyangiaceae bacterium]|nr:pyridoxamine 5'-phosphate oxidase [Polyangiaceae bacterium]